MIAGERGWEDCGWAILKPQGRGAWCGRKKVSLGPGLPIFRCPCESWVKRGRLDRLRGKAGRRSC